MPLQSIYEPIALIVIGAVGALYLFATEDYALAAVFFLAAVVGCNELRATVEFNQDLKKLNGE